MLVYLGGGWENSLKTLYEHLQEDAGVEMWLKVQETILMQDNEWWEILQLK